MKTCPSCGAKAFDDLDRCYECLEPFDDGPGRDDAAGALAPWEENAVSIEDGGEAFDAVPQAMLGKHVALSSVSNIEHLGEVSAYTIDSNLGEASPFGEAPADEARHAGESLVCGWTVRVNESGRPERLALVAEDAPLRIGRASDNDIELHDRHVSRHHAELTYDGTTWRIRDLNSTNGTLVNDVDIDSCVLRDGALTPLGLLNLELRES